MAAMKPLLALLLATALLSACSTTATPKTPAKQGAAAMTATQPAYTPPLAEGYQPGVPTLLEKGAAQSPIGADEIVNRMLHLAKNIRTAEELTLEKVEKTLGVKLADPASNTNPNAKKIYLWLSPHWLVYLAYTPPDSRQEGTALIAEFTFDNAHWADMPDRAELCANRQMDVAAAEKILLDNGFRMTLDPDTRFRDRWAYYREDVASVRMYSFGEGPLGNKHACIRKIELFV